MKETKSKSQEAIRASNDAASIIAATRSALKKLRNGGGAKCKDEEWHNLSQDLKTLQTNNATLEVKAKAIDTAESREKMNPEAPIEQDNTSTTYNNIVLPDSSLSINRDIEASRVYLDDNLLAARDSRQLTNQSSTD